MLGVLIAASCGAALMWLRERPSPRAPLERAQLLVDAERVDEALAALDAVDTRALAPEAITQWLNLKALALALAGRADEALELLDDLVVILDSEDGPMQLCAAGNRGIALLAAGRLDEAEPLLDETERLAAELRARDPRYADACEAETWWWRAELARRRGDATRARECLSRGAGFHFGSYAEKARRQLAV